MSIKPFFINSNLCSDLNDIISFKNYQNAINYNIGNSYPTWALIKQIYGYYKKPKHIKNIWRYDFSQQDKDIDTINNECSHVFLMLQDQIRIVEGYGQVLPFENMINFIKRLNKKIIVLSLGCNQYYKYDNVNNQFIVENQLEKDFCKKLDPSLINFLKVISDYTELIGVRGYYTQEVLSNLGINNTQVIGCPSYYEMGRNRIVKKKPFNDIKNILIASPYNAFNSQKPFDFPDKNYNYAYMLQDEAKYLVKHWENEKELKNKNFNMFSDITSWKNFVKNFDLFWGYRIHGSILSINSGVPPLFITPDIKGKEMAEFLNIPHNSSYIKENNIEKIYNEINLDKLNHDYNKLYDEYCKFLAKNDLIIEPKKKSLINLNSTQPKLYNTTVFSLQNIFSLRNEKNHKVIRILWFKIRLKRANQ